MRVADRRHFKLKNKKRKMPRWLKVLLIVLGAIAALFVLANLVVALLYRNKVLPNYSVASVPISNIKFDELDAKVPSEELLPEKITLKKDDKTKETTPQDLGVGIDWEATRENIKQARSWLPLTSFVFKSSVPAELRVDNAKFAAASKDLETEFKKDPRPEHIAFRGDNFVIAEPEDGYKLDVVQLRVDLVDALEDGTPELSVPAETIASEGETGKLQDDLVALRKHLDAKITLISGDKKKQLGRADIAGFFESDGQTLKLSDAKIKQVAANVASDFGIKAVNQSELAMTARYALNKQKPVEFVLASQGAKVHHYCVAARGLDSSVLGEYRHKLAAVYADPQGWNNGGQIAFVYTESGCDFTAWLSSPAEMTSFGSYICDNYYSCRVGTNVIVNNDRWKGATDAWNSAGGSLEDYRVMVINHETGHWLDFRHRDCPGSGQPAPVMQQQSIDLQGCKFNPWPTPAELSSL